MNYQQVYALLIIFNRNENKEYKLYSLVQTFSRDKKQKNYFVLYGICSYIFKSLKKTKFKSSLILSITKIINKK